MNGRDVYKIWAPYNFKWSPWVRPVPFVQIDRVEQDNSIVEFELPKINYINEYDKNTAIFIDLPECESIEHGIVLAKMGYQPVPLFNGTNPNIGATSSTNNRIIEDGLIWGAEELKNINFKDEAPVFLLDSNRMNYHKMNEGIFDNSWDIYHQDMPSYKFFIDNDINKIIIISNKVEEDLNIILYKFPKDKFTFYFSNGYDDIKLIKLKKPKRERV